jgi:NADPH:quinone reductase-like Zn-dependent oxidoreductase
MLRKLALEPGARILVTAAKSNTSLFAINALRRRDARVFATSTSSAFAEELAARGVEELVILDPEVAEGDRLEELARDLGGFDAVFDPLFDVHLHRAVSILAPGGRYTTCGLHDQHSTLLGRERPAPPLDVRGLMSIAMAGNLSLIGNCIGAREDLARAAAEYEAGELEVIVDSVYGGRQAGAFLERTYRSRERFGKVVYRWDD